MGKVKEMYMDSQIENLAGKIAVGEYKVELIGKVMELSKDLPPNKEGLAAIDIIRKVIDLIK